MSHHLARIRAHRVRVSPKTVWWLLELIDRDGRSGWGEFTIGADAAALTTRVEHLQTLAAPLLEAPGTVAVAAPLLRDWPLGAAVYSAFDQALWDLHAQAAGQRLAEVVAGGAVSEPVALYANINRGTLDRSPGGFHARARQALADGHVAVKMAPFDDLRPADCASATGAQRIDAGLERIRAARDALGPAPALMVDCHWRFTEQAALAVLPALADAAVSWFECPIEETPASVPALVRLRAAANEQGMRLAGCETMTGWDMFSDYVAGGAYDVIMPDLKYLGGYAELRRIIERSAEHGVQVSLHNPTGPIAHVASLHLSAALPATGRLEFQYAESELFQTLVDDAVPDTAGGHSPLPAGPGLGVRPRRDLLETL